MTHINDWRLPTPDEWLSQDTKSAESKTDESLKVKLENALKTFNVPSKVTGIAKGASFTRYEVELEPGVKVSRILSIENDIAIAFGVESRFVRIEAPIPGRSAIGIEAPNAEKGIVPFRKVFMSDEFQNNHRPLTCVLGENISGAPIIFNLHKLPHLLIAGTANSGKSVCLNSMLCSILARHSPDEVRLILVDFKRTELTSYNNVPHLATPVIHELSVAADSLKWACEEMDRRYKLFAEKGVRNIESYNEQTPDAHDHLYRIVIAIDEYSDLMIAPNSEKNMENHICRITQLARATGIHIILATQRTDTKVITGCIKNNIPSRISFSVSSQIDSRTVIDQKGAESLLGQGDMLFLSVDSSKLSRVQGAYITDKEIDGLTEFWRTQNSPDYIDCGFHNSGSKREAFTTDSGSGVYYRELLFVKAALLVVSTNEVSISKIQKEMGVDYATAAVLIKMLEERGIIGCYDDAKSHKVLVPLIELHKHLVQTPTSQNKAVLFDVDSPDDTEALYEKAVDIVVSTQIASLSMIQRKLRIGYNRATRLVELMEERRIVGPLDGKNQRKVLKSPPEL